MANLAAACVLCPGVCVLGQVPKLNPDLPQLRGDQVSSYTIPWMIAGLALAGILLIAFRNSKRNHMD